MICGAGETGYDILSKSKTKFAGFSFGLYVFHERNASSMLFAHPPFRFVKQYGHRAAYLPLLSFIDCFCLLVPQSIMNRIDFVAYLYGNQFKKIRKYFDTVKTTACYFRKLVQINSFFLYNVLNRRALESPPVLFFGNNNAVIRMLNL